MIYFKFRYIFFLLLIRTFHDLVSLIDPSELKIQETTDTAASVSFLDTYLEFNTIGHINTRTNNKWDNFNSEIINFPQSSSNITNFIYIWLLHSPTDLILQLLLWFIKRHNILRRKLVIKYYVKKSLILFLKKKLIGRYQDLVDKCSL